MSLYSYAVLEDKVVQWAKERQIIPNSNPTSQLMKTMSELGELADATIKNDRDGIVDGVGDVLVTLILYCALQKVDLQSCLTAAYFQIKDRKGTLTPEGIFVKEAPCLPPFSVASQSWTFVGDPAVCVKPVAGLPDASVSYTVVPSPTSSGVKLE